MNIVLVGQKDCPPLKAPANGEIDFNKKGTRATFSCKRGFSLKGENILNCQNGKWSSQPPVCSK